MEAFKNLHKECEQLKTSGLSTAEIRRVKKSDKITQLVFSWVFFECQFCFCWFCGLIAVYKLHRSELVGTAAAFLELSSVGKQIRKSLLMLRTALSEADWETRLPRLCLHDFQILEPLFLECKVIQSLLLY